MEIRKAVIRDLERLKTLSRQTINTCYPCFMGDEAVSGFIHSGASDGEIDKHFNNTYVATKAGVIFGYVVFFNDLVHIMMVDPLQQRMGVGTQLLKFAEKSIREINLIPTLETFEGNTQAINFYLKNGWKITKKQSDPDFGFVRVYFNKQS